jgi:alginate export protein
MRIELLCLSLTIGMAGISLAQTTQPTTAPSAVPPKYTVSRWDENYGYLQNPSNQTDCMDPIKFVPLDANGDCYASFGGQIRDRYEYFNHYLFGTGPQTRDGYNLARITENLDLHFGPDLRVFLQGDSAFETGRDGGPRATDRDELDLEQGFADYTIPICSEADLTLRAGRQYLQFGAERLIGPADFLNVRHNFDGFRSNLDSQDNSLDFFLVRPVLIEPYKFDSSDDKNALAGIYDTLKLPQFLPDARSKLEMYALYLDRLDAVVPNMADGGTEDVYTLGTRFTSAPKPFDFDVEGDYQLGSYKSADINAYSFATKDGYTLSDVVLHPRVYFGFDIASGGNKNAGTVGTFNQLFPTGHGQFGNIDAIGRQNIIDIDPGLDLTLLEHQQFVDSLKLRVSFYEFWRESLEDVVYTASGAVLRDAGTSNSRYVGDELDLLVNWQIDRHLSTYVGYSHFFPGGFISQTGSSQGIDFFYTAVTCTF